MGKNGCTTEDSLISSIGSEVSTQRHSTPKKRTIREEPQDAAPRRLAYDIADRGEANDAEAVKIPLRRFKSRFQVW